MLFEKPRIVIDRVDVIQPDDFNIHKRNFQVLLSYFKALASAYPQISSDVAQLEKQVSSLPDVQVGQKVYHDWFVALADAWLSIVS